MPLLEVKSLVKNYGRRRVVDGVSFEVDSGEVVGLLGPNGAGKTTSFRMTTGQISPYSGKVIFNGTDVTRLPMYRRARLGMGYLSQETSVFRKLTVEQNILAILEVLPVARSLGRRLTRSERWERTNTVLEQFGLIKVRKNNAARLSGGEKRRLEIARCLVCEPLLILLDEPFTGIDPKTIGDIQHIVIQLRNQGIGVLLTDHNVREALKITDRSYLIKDGKVRTHGTPRQIVHDPVAINEYLGQGFHDDMLTPPSPRRNESKRVEKETSQPELTESTTDDYYRSKSKPVEKGASQPAAAKSRVKESASKSVVKQEKISALIDDLKTREKDLAAAELIQHGPKAIPFLLQALERRDVELRRLAHEILQAICQTSIAFDPYAPEALRRQQLLALLERWERKAG